MTSSAAPDPSASPHDRSTWSRVAGVLAATAVVATTAAVAAPAAGAAEGETPAPEATTQEGPVRAAFFTPFLNMAYVGTTVAGPLGCNTATGAIGLVVSDPTVGNLLAPFIANINENCSLLTGSSGTIPAYIVFFRTMASPVAALNPFMDSGMEAFAAQLDGFNKAFGPSIAPFGPTMTDFAAAVRFFKADVENPPANPGEVTG